MKAKKLFLPAIILAMTIVVMMVYSVIASIAKKPTITEKDFPFSITYELNGKTEIVEGIYSVSFTGNGGYADTTTRIYKGEFISSREDIDTSYVISKNSDGTIMMHTKFHADYLMGDTVYDYFSDEAFAPTLIYFDSENHEYTDEQTLMEHGAKLISWEYPKPIENSFVFSHIAPLSGEVVIPLALMAALALIAVMILVKKEKDLNKQRIDRVSVIVNFVIALTVLPFAAIYGMLSDITGTSVSIMHQIGYFVPAITILGLAASVGLRRKGFHKSSFFVQLAGPVVLAVIMGCLLC